jgi:hypothetical protein
MLRRFLAGWVVASFAILCGACGSSSKNNAGVGGSGNTSAGGASGSAVTDSGGSGGLVGTAGGGASGAGGSGGSGGDIDGGNPGCTAKDGGFGFPSTPMRDDFNREDGVVGGSWSVNPASNAFSIENGQLVKNTDSTILQVMLWPVQFGPDQEAFVTLSEIDTTFTEMVLTLKAQNPSSTCSSVSVLYAPSTGQVEVWLCETANQWVKQGGKAVLFQAGDRLGGRARANGVVEVYRNSEQVAEYSVANWSAASNGGYIGISPDVYGKVRSYDDFGGGTFECEN